MWFIFATYIDSKVNQECVTILKEGLSGAYTVFITNKLFVGDISKVNYWLFEQSKVNKKKKINNYVFFS